MHSSRILLLALATFITGTAIEAYLELPALTPIVLFGLGVLGLLFSARIVPVAWFWRARFIVVGLVCLSLAAGIIRFETVYRVRNVIPEFAIADAGLSNESKNRIRVKLYGYIDDLPQNITQGTRLNVRIVALQSDKRLIRTDERVRLITNDNQWRYGETVSIIGTPRLPDNEFKYILAKDGITADILKPEIQATEIKLGFSKRLGLWFLRPAMLLKQKFETALSRSVPGAESAFIDGTLLGTRSTLPATVVDDFRKTGIGHVVAVSGYNMTIIAAAAVSLLVLFISRRWAIIGAIVCMLLFTYMTGASASVLRAAIMGIVTLAAQLFGRQSRSSTAIILAAFLMIFLNPLIVRYDIGFQLSFFATLGILYLQPLLINYLKWLPSLYSLRETSAMTLAAQVAVMPLLAFYFGSVSLISLPVNLLVLPLIPLVMLLGLIAGIGGLLWLALGRILGLLAWLPAKLILLLAHYAALIPGASLTFQPSWYVVALFYILMISFLVYTYRYRRAWLNL